MISLSVIIVVADAVAVAGVFADESDRVMVGEVVVSCDDKCRPNAASETGTTEEDTNVRRLPPTPTTPRPPPTPPTTAPRCERDCDAPVTPPADNADADADSADDEEEDGLVVEEEDDDDALVMRPAQ